MRLETMIFLITVGVFLAVWGLRGFGVLTFLPGVVIWVLLLCAIGAGVVDMVQRTRRW